MSASTNILGRLRRRRARLGRSIWILFAFASLSGGAAPCFAMAASTGPAAAQHDGSHAHAISSHDHSHAAVHEHGISSDAASHSPSPCPHCPLAVGMVGTSSHSFCDVVDDASDGGKPSAPPVLFKPLPSAAVVELLPVDQEPRRASPRRPPVEATTPSLALNLRHCVFLI
jgi:hypothetical protein